MRAHLSFLDARSGCGIVLVGGWIAPRGGGHFAGPERVSSATAPAPACSAPLGGRSLRGRADPAAVNGRAAQLRLRVLTSMYQTTHRANADTITPAQYQPRSASSPIRLGLARQIVRRL